MRDSIGRRYLVQPLLTLVPHFTNCAILHGDERRERTSDNYRGRAVRTAVAHPRDRADVWRVAARLRRESGQLQPSRGRPADTARPFLEVADARGALRTRADAERGAGRVRSHPGGGDAEPARLPRPD